MGQSTSLEEYIQDDDLFKHATILTEIATLSYDRFVEQLAELNKLSQVCPDSDGNQLILAVQKGTDSSILWKGTVKIGCLKINPGTKKIESYRLLNLAEFIQVFKTLQGHMQCMEEAVKDNEPEPGASNETAPASGNNYLTASMLFQHVDEMSAKKSKSDKCSECCICLERKPEVILPCVHSYCLPCIEQWNVNNKTCPICRERLETTDDTWIISEAPDVEEISNEIHTVLNELSQISPTRQVKS